MKYQKQLFSSLILFLMLLQSTVIIQDFSSDSQATFSNENFENSSLTNNIENSNISEIEENSQPGKVSSTSTTENEWTPSYSVNISKVYDERIIEGNLEDYSYYTNGYDNLHPSLWEYFYLYRNGTIDDLYQNDGDLLNITTKGADGNSQMFCDKPEWEVSDNLQPTTDYTTSNENQTYYQLQHFESETKFNELLTAKVTTTANIESMFGAYPFVYAWSNNSFTSTLSFQINDFKYITNGIIKYATVSYFNVTNSWDGDDSGFPPTITFNNYLSINLMNQLIIYNKYTQQYESVDYEITAIKDDLVYSAPYNPPDIPPVSQGYSQRIIIHSIDSIALNKEKTETLRLEYKYLEDPKFKLFKLTVNEFYGYCNVSVKLPYTLNYSHSLPSVEWYLETLENFYFYVTTPEIIQLYFFMGDGWGRDFSHKNQFLCISETTSNYLDHVGFEDGESDWVDYSGYEWSSRELDTSIVSSGAFSEQFTSSTSSRRIISLGSLLSANYYYYSFDYLFSSDTVGNMYVYTHNGIDWDQQLLDSTKERWNTIYGYVYFAGGTNAFRLDTISNFVGSFYLDNFRIYEANPSLITTEYGKQELSVIPVSWDNLLNPKITKDIKYKAKIRHNSTILASGTLTNTNGYKTILELTNDQFRNEIELEAYCEDSWFGDYSYDYYTESDCLSKWSYSAFDDCSESLGESLDNSMYSYEINGNSGAWYDYVIVSIDDFSSIDVSDMYLSFIIKINTTTGWDTGDVGYASSALAYDTNNDHLQWHWFDYAPITSQINEIKVILDFDDMSVDSSFDKSIFDRFELRYRNITNSASIKINLDAFHFIKSQKSYLQPLDVEYNNNYAEWDFSDETTQSFIQTSPGGSITSENGYLLVKNDGSRTYQTIRIADQTIDSEYYNVAIFCVKPNVTGSSIQLRDSALNQLGVVYTIAANVWTTYIVELDEDWTGTETNFELVFNTATSNKKEIKYDFVFLCKKDSVSLYETDSYFYTSSSNNTLESIFYSDNNLLGSTTDLHTIPKNSTIGSHELTYYVFNDLDQESCYISSSEYSYSYEIVDSDLTTISILDQQSNFIDPRTFQIFINSERIQGDTFLDSDTSNTYNLTINDFWGNILYQNLVETYSRFKDFVLTLYSVKIWNIQENPIYLEISNGPTFSEWILPGEIIEYKLKSDTYNFTIRYSSDVIGFSSAVWNGTSTQYIFGVNSDTALVISGTSIQDVFNNVVSLSNNLIDVNTTLTNQIISVNISISNFNTSITNQVVDVEIHLDNINSTITDQLILINTDINNMQSNITLQINDIDLTLYNINSTIFSQTVNILSNLANINSTLFTQTLSILTNIQNTNSTLYSQTVNILSNLANINSTLFSQTLSILTNIQNVNSTIFNQNLALLNNLANINSTLYNQTVSVITLIAEGFGIYRVHFNVVDSLGIGLNFETIFLTVNNSRQYNSDLYVSNNTNLSIIAYDYFNIELYSTSISIQGNTDINISIALYYVSFMNNGSYTAYLEIYRNNELGINQTILPGKTLTIRMTSGIYDYKTYYYKIEQNESYIENNLIDYDKTLLELGSFKVTSSIPTLLNVSTPTKTTITPKLSNLQEFWNGLISGFAISSIGLAVAGFILFLMMREGYWIFKGNVLKKASDDSLIIPNDVESKQDRLNYRYNKNRRN